MPNLPDAVLWSIPAFVLLTVIEMISVRVHPDEDAAGYETKDAVTSVGMGDLALKLLQKPENTLGVGLPTEGGAGAA